jgi:hypothetical protein
MPGRLHPPRPHPSAGHLGHRGPAFQRHPGAEPDPAALRAQRGPGKRRRPGPAGRRVPGRHRHQVPEGAGRVQRLRADLPRGPGVLRAHEAVRRPPGHHHGLRRHRHQLPVPFRARRWPPG